MKSHKGESKEDRKIGWTKDQDDYLMSLIPETDKCDWKTIAEEANKRFAGFKRSPQEYSKRWLALINGAESKEPWSKQEELNMIIAHNKYKNKWAEMGIVLKGRNNNTIKNKFYSIFRRIKGKIQKSDFNFESKLELLEIYYIISLIEQYLVKPNQNPKIKGKRGKDFIYSLVHNISPETVKIYKEKIEILGKNYGNMEELFKELTANSQASTVPIAPATAVVNSIEESKPVVGEYIEGLSTLRDNSELQHKECNDIFSQARFQGYESPLDFDLDYIPPTPIFSPPSLSAGPAAAAAGASRAACFTDQGGFSDLSSQAKTANDERVKYISMENNKRLLGGTSAEERHEPQ